MKSDFCKPDRNHLREVVSNRIWTDASQSQRLQTLRSVLTVRDVTLRDARPNAPVRPLTARLFRVVELDINGMEQEDAENISPWTEDETKCLITLWGDGSVQAKLEGMYRNKSIYESILRSLRERGFRRTWVQCQRKIKSLKTKYKEIKDNNNKSGTGRNNCPFYDLLDSILGDKPSVRPLMVLDSSAPNEEGEEEDLNSGDAGE